jgi:hypothetical protein
VEGAKTLKGGSLRGEKEVEQLCVGPGQVRAKCGWWQRGEGNGRCVGQKPSRWHKLQGRLQTYA